MSAIDDAVMNLNLTANVTAPLTDVLDISPPNATMLNTSSVPVPPQPVCFYEIPFSRFGTHRRVLTLWCAGHRTWIA